MRKLKAGETTVCGGASARVKLAEARTTNLPSKPTASRWVNTKAKELSREQRGLLQRIVDRCYQEAEDDAAGRASASVPLRWLLHGKPGTGKSHVLRCIISFFKECLRWQQGVQFCVAALQAVTAAAVGGDTLHHTAAINPFFHNVDSSASDGLTSSRALQQRLLCCRWLLIDEAFMLSAQLLADVDTKFRSGVSDSCKFKRNAAGDPRAFGGINLLLCGDMYQLVPPEGTPLYNIPHDLLPASSRKAPTAHTFIVVYLIFVLSLLD